MKTDTIIILLAYMNNNGRVYKDQQNKITYKQSTTVQVKTFNINFGIV